MEITKLNLRNFSLCRKKGERSYWFYGEIFYDDLKIGKLLGKKTLIKDKKSRNEDNYSTWTVSMKYNISPLWKNEILESVDKFKKLIRFKYPANIKKNEFPEDVGQFLLKLTDALIIRDIIKKSKKRNFKYLIRAFRLLDEKSKKFELEFYEINNPNIELSWILKKHPDSKIMIYEKDKESGISIYGECYKDCFCPKCIKRCSSFN